MAFGKEIKRLREEARISAQKLADKIGIKAERLRKWEEKDLDPRDEDASRIESFFGRSIFEINKLDSIKQFLNVPNNGVTPHTSNGITNYVLELKNPKTLDDYIDLLERQNQFLQGLVKSNLTALQDGQKRLEAYIKINLDHTGEIEARQKDVPAKEVHDEIHKAIVNAARSGKSKQVVRS